MLDKYSMNKNLVSKANKNLVLKKTKSLLSITSKILTPSFEELWIIELWQWIEEHIAKTSDKNNITLPKTKSKMLALSSLNLDVLSFDNFETIKFPITLAHLLNLRVLSLYSWFLIDEIQDEMIHHNNLLLKYILEKQVNLTILELDSFYFSKIPKEVVNLINLKKLTLSGNNLKELPKEIGYLNDLTDLDVSSNQIILLPEEIQNLVHLRTLNLLGNPLELTLKQKQWIEELKENECIVMLDEVEDWIEDIWRWADIHQITMQKIPRTLNNLLSLTELNFYNINLGEFPQQLCHLENITTLILWDNNLRELPEEIINFKNLKKLNLRGNPLSYSVQQVKWLDDLRAEGCVIYIDQDNINQTEGFNEDIDFNYLPKETTNSHWLDSDLGKKQDSWIERLVELANQGHSIGPISDNKDDLLSLDCISIVDLGYVPKELEYLSSLKCLILGSMTSISSNIANLRTLKTLEISGAITQLPKELWELKNLEELALRRVKFTILSSGLGKLSKLKKLTLFSCDIKVLPIEIKYLTELEELNLFNTSIDSLPKEILKLKKLKKICILNTDIASREKNKEIIAQLKLNGCILDGYRIP